MPIPTVQPGDLITAGSWNDLAAAVNSLEARVAQLEGGGTSTLRITQVSPSGAVTAGDTIRIAGSGFAYSRREHSVFFGSTRATTFASDSSDSMLIVQVPDPVAGATPQGAQMTMTVGNLNESATWPLTIRSRPEETSGGVQFTYRGSRPATPTQNASVDYDFELGSFASRDLTVTITPTVQVTPPLPAGVPDPGLAGRLSVIDADGSVRPTRQVSLAEGQSKVISVRLDLPNGTNGVRYSLNVVASAPGVTPVTESLPTQQVGQQGEQPDPTVANFEFASIAAGDGSFSTETGGVSGVDGTLRVRQGTLATVEMRAQFTGIPAGTTNNYQLSGAIEGPANGWSVGVNPVMQNPQPVSAPGGLIPVFFDITAPGSTATAVVRLTLTRQGAATGNTRSVAYRLVPQA